MMRDDRTKRDLDQLLSVLDHGRSLTRLIGALSGLFAGVILGLLYLRNVGRLDSGIRTNLVSILIVLVLLGVNLYTIRYARAEAVSVYNVSTDTVEGLVGSALHEAIIGKNSSIARRFINEAGALEYRDARGATPLHLAVESGMRDLVTVLLANEESDVDAIDIAGATPLLYAARSGDAEIARLLLDAGAGVGSRESSTGQTVLHPVAANEDTILLKHFLDHGADPSVSDRAGVAPLVVAFEGNNRRGVLLLIEHGADPNQTISGGLSLLQVTLRDHLDQIEKSRSLLAESDLTHLDLFAMLLERGADADVVDDHSATPLHWASAAVEALAAESENTWAIGRAIELLMAHGADVAKENAAGTPAYQLVHAARIGRLADVQRTLQADVSRLERTNSRNKTPLQVAVEEGHQEVVAYLLSQGADPGHWNRGDQTSLAYCVTQGDTEMLLLLLSNGATTNGERDKKGNPLHLAAQLGDAESTRLLLEHGFDASIQAPRGDTALHFAAGSGALNCIKLLLSNGANPTTWNSDGVTPLAIAKAEGHSDVHAYLKDWIWENREDGH